MCPGGNRTPVVASVSGVDVFLAPEMRLKGLAGGEAARRRRADAVIIVMKEFRPQRAPKQSNTVLFVAKYGRKTQEIN